MLRRTLLAASGSDRARRLITSAPLARDVVARYVAGDTTAEAVRVSRELLQRGLLVSLDYLGEDSTDPEQAAAVTAEYCALLTQLGEGGLAAGGRAEVSVKPTAVGLGLAEHGVKTATGNIARICAAARVAGTTVTVDMEDHTRVDQTLRIAGEIRPDHPDLGVVIQSSLRRSVADCAALAQAGSRVRLCKGAYDAPAEVAYPARHDVDRSYARALRVLMDGAGYPMIATHDPRLLRIAAAQAELGARTPDSYEFQMLHGVRAAEQRRLAATGARLRVYLPYGQDWYRYLVRRLAERPANVLFLVKNFFRS